MKKIIFSLLAALLVSTTVSAQQAEISKAAKRYKAATTVTANVKLTRHNAAMTKDVVSNGHFYYKKSKGESMVFKDTKEMFLAAGDTFTMVRNGKQSATKANGTGNNPFEVLCDVFRNLLSSDDYSKLSTMADVKMKTQGNTCTITVTPVATDTKSKRKMMYSSCTATIDLKAGELRTLRINERGENYSQYDFSNFVIGGEVNNNVFDTKTVM